MFSLFQNVVPSLQELPRKATELHSDVILRAWGLERAVAVSALESTKREWVEAGVANIGKYRQTYIGKYAQIYTQIYTQIYATPSLTSNNYDDAGFQILKPVTERSYLGSASVLSSKALFVCLFFFKGLGSLWGYQIFVAGLANHAGYYECIQINNPKVLTHVHCIALCCVVSCRFALRCNVLSRVVLCLVVLHCVVSCRVVTTCYTACQVIMVLCFV